MSMSEVTEKLASTLRDRWIEARKCLGKPLPLILHEEVYEHFGEWCKIVEANVYDEVENAEVVIENRSGERHQLEFRLLSWRTNYDLMKARSEKSLAEIIIKGPS